MIHDTEKMCCSTATVHRHGGRRRRCSNCGKTWRAWPRKRGRKKRPRRRSELDRFQEVIVPFWAHARRSKRSAGALAKRHRKLLAAAVENPWDVPLPEGELILVMDALWLKFAMQEHTLYLMAVRSTTGTVATFLAPVLMRGHESAETWRKVIDTMPKEVEKRVVALVADGFRSVEYIAGEHNWVYQSCIFHVLAHMYEMRGQHRRLVFREGRRRAEQIVRLLIKVDKSKVEPLRQAAYELAKKEDCPPKLTYRLNYVAFHLRWYRAYLDWPELNLPTTTNVVENMNSRIRGLLAKTRGFRTPRAFYLWIYAYVRRHPTGRCNPKIPPN